jgi:hypothetical protein
LTGHLGDQFEVLVDVEHPRVERSPQWPRSGDPESTPHDEDRSRPTRGDIASKIAGVLAEAWRGGPQHRLSMLLQGCKIEDLTEL